MKSHSSTAVDRLSKLSLLGTTALIASFGFAPMAYAQDAGFDATIEELDEDDDVVVSTGIRQSLKEARDLKRDADTAIDSITASDVSTLPDLSVAEALARVPGVVVQRFDITSRDGGDFPSPEGGGNLIRGLTLVRSEFNGRDAFSANGGRSLDFGTIPPELIGAVDVYKNTSADLIEGGIGGTINLRTLEPFDRSGTIAVATIDGTYTDLREEFTPDYSFILGDRWDTGAGEFGLLGSFSSSELKSDLNGFQIGQYAPLEVGGQRIAVPTGVQLRTNEVDRERDSYYIAGQWRDKSGDLQVTAKYSLIENDVEGNERTLEYFQDGESWFAQADADGLFNSGQLTGDSLTSVGGNVTTTPFSSDGLPACNGANDPGTRSPVTDSEGGGPGPVFCEDTFPVTALYESGIITNTLRDWTGARGANFSNLGINQVESSQTDDLSVNVKWRANDKLFVQLDGHKTTAEFDRRRLWIGSRFFSDFSVRADLDNPGLTLFGRPDSNPNLRTGASTLTPTGLVSDPNTSYLLYSADEFADNEGDLYALRGDVEYEFDGDGWFDAIKFGARYAERDQTNRSAGLNWAGVAPPWQGGGYLPYAELETPAFELVNFSDFFRGGVVQGTNNTVVFADRALLKDYDAWVAVVQGDPAISDPDGGFGPDWNPLRNSEGVVDYAGRGEIGDVREETQNYYARLDFGNEFNNGMSLEGNVGLRYTTSDVFATGGFNYVSLTENASVEGLENLQEFVPDAIAFSNQDSVLTDGQISSDDRWLPSLNLKWNVNDDLLVRFAASEAITRPRIEQLRVDQRASVGLTFINEDPAGLEPGVRPELLDIIPTGINVSGGNPNLKPIESTNLDLSFEYYYGDNNSLTLAFFNKDIRNNIIFGAESTGQTANIQGVEVPFIFRGDVNQDEATVRGLELAYQQFYDELPGFLGNLGLQANYTYIDASTNPPDGSADADGDGRPDSFDLIFRYGVDDFLGLSEHTANLIGIYQDDSLEMRLAYNWRSDYLSSYRDFVTGNPIYQDDNGFLDGSIKYDFNENFQVRFQIANILDTKSKALQQVDASGQRLGRTSFITDRRIRIGARYAF